MMREDWEVGGVIRAAYNYPEESYEPTASVQKHAFGREKQPASGSRPHSDLGFGSIKFPFIMYGENVVPGLHVPIRFTPSTYGEKSPSGSTPPSIRHFFLF